MSCLRTVRRPACQRCEPAGVLAKSLSGTAARSPYANKRSTPLARAASPTSRCSSPHRLPSSFMSPSTSQLSPGKSRQEFGCRDHGQRVCVVAVVEKGCAMHASQRLQATADRAHAFKRGANHLELTCPARARLLPQRRRCARCAHRRAAMTQRRSSSPSAE